jgi:lipopolysaccharide transport system permease protein
MMSELKELWRFRELLVTMVQRDLKIRYKNSAIGFAWSLLNPLITVLVMTFVFKNFMGMDVPNLSAYMLAGYLPFIFFQLCLMDSAQSVLTAMPLIKKIYFPREILPLAAVISNFIHLVLALCVFFLYLLAVHLIWPGQSPFQIGTLWLPVLLIINLALALGLAFYISAFNTFYEDVKYIVGVLLYLLFFLCPVVYFSERVANSPINQKSHWLVYKVMYGLNPMAELCDSYRKLLLAPIKVPMGVDPITHKQLFIDPVPFDFRYLGAAAFLSFFLLITGYMTFNRLKWKFVERP